MPGGSVIAHALEKLDLENDIHGALLGRNHDFKFTPMGEAHFLEKEGSLGAWPALREAPARTADDGEVFD